MNLYGLSLCCRYSNPPNSLSLCGPDKNGELSYYTEKGRPDGGTASILSQFSTLFPYLCLIAQKNNFKDPFDAAVVEAYWLGNPLLSSVSVREFSRHLSERVGLKRRLARHLFSRVLSKLYLGAVPHHSFHVVNIYQRTGHLNIPHTIPTIDACIVNWGKVKGVFSDSIVVQTQAVVENKDGLGLRPIIRKILFQGVSDYLSFSLSPGDWISYHWGRFCQKLTVAQLRNLVYYTQLSFTIANKKK